jgi:hypothetical protein
MNEMKLRLHVVLVGAVTLAGCSTPVESGQDEAAASQQPLIQATGPQPDDQIKQELMRGRAQSPAAAPFVDPELERELSETPETGRSSVAIFLADDPAADDELLTESASGQVGGGRAAETTLNGRITDDVSYNQYLVRETARIRAAENERRARNAARWQAIAARYQLAGELGDAAVRGADSATISARRKALADLAANEKAGGVVRAVIRPFSPVGADGLTSALGSVEVSTSAIPAGFNGTNIGVWMNDGDGKPITTTACVNNNRLTVQDFGSEPDEAHATQTLCTLMATAPDARVHYAVPTQGCNLRSDVANFTNPQVFLSSQSNSFSDNTTAYSDCSRDWDNFVYNTLIAHFALTQNQASNVRGAAKAYNVFSIGAYDDPANPDVVASFSNSGDPATGADKPEFVAPGVNIDVGTWTNLSGTSFATPIAAGFAADLLEQFNFLRFQPPLLKAYLLVNSVDIDGTNPFGDADGAGRLDYSNTAFGRWAWWSGGNGAWFSSDTDGDGRLEIS